MWVARKINNERVKVDNRGVGRIFFHKHKKKQERCWYLWWQKKKVITITICLLTDDRCRGLPPLGEIPNELQKKKSLLEENESFLSVLTAAFVGL